MCAQDCYNGGGIHFDGVTSRRLIVWSTHAACLFIYLSSSCTFIVCNQSIRKLEC